MNLTELIGPNWRTSVCGAISKLALGFLLACQFQPNLIYDIFGESAWSKRVVSVGLFLWFAFGLAKDFNTKDKQVAGNNPDVVSQGKVQTKIAP